MIHPSTQIPVINLDEFIEEYGKAPFELDEGERSLIMAPQIIMSGRRGFRFAYTLSTFVEQHALGEVFVEVPFVITLDNTNWVKGSRTPDVMFYAAERLTQMQQDEDWELKPFIGAPDFVAEVVSPTDKAVDVNKKVMGYLRDGVRLIWIIEPIAKTVTVYTSGSNQFTLHTNLDDELDASPVIPAFKITVRQLV